MSNLPPLYRPPIRLGAGVASPSSPTGSSNGLHRKINKVPEAITAPDLKKAIFTSAAKDTIALKFD